MKFFNLSKSVILETFNNGGLALILPERRLVELNPTAVEIVKLLDGNRTQQQVVSEILRCHGGGQNISNTKKIQDVVELIKELTEVGVLEQQFDFKESADMATDHVSRFLRNPDVVLREEDPDEGALLFNPDTNQVKVINTTGLYIWQQCSVARTLAEIVVEVQKGFDEVPMEQVAQDVQEFVDIMLASGFIGTVETKH